MMCWRDSKMQIATLMYSTLALMAVADLLLGVGVWVLSLHYRMTTKILREIAWAAKWECELTARQGVDRAVGKP